MSKILKVLIVLVTILAVAAPVVIAEDRLSLSGTMRVRAFTFNEYDFDDSVDTSNSFFDQRLRIGGKLSVAEGVSVTFRTDITETKWGDNTNVRPAVSQQWDRAHIDITKGMVSTRVGQYYAALGSGMAFDNQGTGFQVALKSSIPVKFVYFRQDINIGNLFDEDTNPTGRRNTETDNADLYAVQVDHKTDNYAANVFVAYAHNDASTDDLLEFDSNIYLVGLSGNFSAGPVYLRGELDFFGGDYIDAAGIDAKGLQGYIDASMPINEAWTLGAMFIYADGKDNRVTGDNEQQITVLGNAFGGWSPETYGPFTTDFAEALPGGSIYNPTGNDNGVVALQIYNDYKINDELDLTGALMYLAPEDDKLNGNDTLAGSNLDSAIIANIGLDYQLMANAKLASQFNYTAKSAMQGGDPDGAYALMGRVQVNF